MHLRFSLYGVLFFSGLYSLDKPWWRMSINIIRRKCLLTLQYHGSRVTPCSHKVFGRSLRCPSSAISTAGRPGPPKEARLTSTASLASDFQQLSEREIKNILTAYNQLLPYSYSHEEAVRYMLQKRTDVFAKLFRTNFQHFFVRWVLALHKKTEMMYQWLRDISTSSASLLVWQTQHYLMHAAIILHLHW